MDARKTERRMTTYLQALQTWERAQVLMADARALCEVALEAQSRSEELRVLRPTVLRP